MSQNSSTPVICIPPGVASVGSGILFMPLLLAIQSVQRKGDVGAATGTEVFVRNLGLTVAVAVATVVLENYYDRAIKSFVKDGSVPGIGHRGGHQAAEAWDSGQKLLGAQRNAYEDAHASGLRWTWALMACVLVAGLVASLSLRDVRLDSKDPVNVEMVLEFSRVVVVPN
jgi:hypothetical protein